MIRVPLWKWSAEVVSSLEDRIQDGTITVVKSRRQAGKSVSIIQLLSITALKHKDSISCCVEPTYQQARRLFKQLTKQWKHFIESSAETRLEVNFKNGSQVQFFSAGQGDNLRGPTVSGILVIDEAAYVPDEVYHTILPWRDVHRAPIFLVSTPRFKQGFFFTEYLHALNGDQGYHLFDWADSKYDDKKYCSDKTTMSDILPQSTLDHYRSVLSDIMFKMDYLAEFVDAESVLFGDFKRLIQPLLDDTPVCVGIDCGYMSGQDYTALVALNKSAQVCQVVRSNKGGAQSAVDLIYDFLVKHKSSIQSVQLESNSIGTPYLDMVKDKLKSSGHYDLARKVKGYWVNHDEKIELITDLQIAFDQDKIHLISNEFLCNELSLYAPHLTPSGKLTYDASEGHDDTVMALAHCWHSWLTNIKPSHSKYVLS